MHRQAFAYAFRTVLTQRTSVQAPTSEAASHSIFMIMPVEVMQKFSLGTSLSKREARGMTLANKITIARILLIPVFVLFAVYYGRGVEQGQPVEWQRWAAIAAFLVASATDGLDGWVARHFAQRSALGAVLDPIADKGLLLTAIITLSLSKWTYGFPLWFPVLVIARDAVIVTGCVLLKHLNGHLDVRPSWMGKAATALQMFAVACVMLQLPFYLLAVIAAGVFTLVSGIGYLFEGAGQLRHHDAPHA